MSEQIEQETTVQNILIMLTNGGERTFLDIAGHQVGQTWVAVITKDDETVLLKTEDVRVIRIWKE